MLITILGPTATGKTRLAAELAFKIDSEIISADSRQVYKRMNIGTGKDLKDYYINDYVVPYHLIDIVEAGEEYNLFQYCNDFHKVYNQIIERNKTPILCGGTGMYIEAVLKGYRLNNVPQDTKLTDNLDSKTNKELIEILHSLKTLHNTTDTLDRNRLLRAVQIAIHHSQFTINNLPLIKSLNFGIHFERDEIRDRITKRLKARLNDNLICEVENLHQNGISYEKLKYYGLEYKYIALYLEKIMTFDEMFERLNIAIHQFAKRQMTWFRRMERNGIKIHWIDGSLSNTDKIKIIIKQFDDLIIW